MKILKYLFAGILVSSPLILMGWEAYTDGQLIPFLIILGKTLGTFSLVALGGWILFKD